MRELLCDLDLRFSRSNFEIAIWEGWLTWNKRDVSQKGVTNPLCDFELWPHLWPWPWIFKVKFRNYRISEMGGPIDMEQKGCKLIGYWTHYVTLNYGLTLDFSWSNFEITISQEWEGRLTWDKRGCELIWCWTHYVTLDSDRIWHLFSFVFGRINDPDL